ncbi:hypothetical protein BaRGS_00035687 [Batillaria attramentaria]|uniref:Receptor protein-tyrosine kinase n=1 Tax=Batillaria attramentaria TaxID=370345 RepID=A0ABD0JE58_9CAEN
MNDDRVLFSPTGYVRPFLVPPLQDGVKRSIPNNTQEDHEGERTIQAITNARGILKFEVSYAQDSGGGLEQPEVPSSPQVPWKQMDLQTTYTVPVTPRDGDTVTTWVKATDAMGNVKVDRTKVTFDSTPPRVNKPVFVMNAMVPGVDFSSTFEMTVRDDHSGVAYTDWIFTRKNGSVVYEERFYGRKATKAECDDNLTGCHCTSAGDCFWFDQSYSLSNCRMMVEKENLDNEVITVTADVTNMAGLVTRETLTITNLTVLNGTEAYFPPQNIKVTSITDGGVTLTWDFPPSCFSRTDVWVIVNDEKRAVHKDAEQFDLTGLDSDTTYTIYLQTRYDGGEMSDRQPLTFTTAESPTSAGLVAGVTISVFLIVLLILFVTVLVLYRRGMILQQPGRIHNQLHRVSTVYDHAKRVTRQSLRRPGHGLMNHAFDPEHDEIYQYGEMTFQTRQGWQLDDSSLTLIDHVAEGKFANIYRATWQHDGRKDIVAAKMPKRGPVLVMEFCDNGQMDKWLAARRDQVGEQTTEDLMQFSLGVAKGMEYLASKGITHRRLAARNILLTSRLDVRVAGFGPQHKEGSEDKATKVPAKWAAPEVLADKPPTEKSDVWSYGVVLWEIFSMGQVPYPTMHSTEIGARIKGGYRMEKPEMADNLHYDLMKECWQYKPTKRPTFKTIRARLEQQFSPGNRQSVDFYYETNQLNPGPSSE